MTMTNNVKTIGIKMHISRESSVANSGNTTLTYFSASVRSRNINSSSLLVAINPARGPSVTSNVALGSHYTVTGELILGVRRY